MKNEYLFCSDKHRKDIEAYKPDSIHKHVYDINDTQLWIVGFSCDANNEESANQLSDVHINVMRYLPKILLCECAEYFNKRLYPLVDAFERKLRKFLYLATSILIDDDTQEKIDNLEKKTLGDIFDILFIDKNFIAAVKKSANGQNNDVIKERFTKAEFIEKLSLIEETTIWDKLFRGGISSVLQKRFREIYEYRNDVMHAHNTDSARYGKAKYLFEQANCELENETNNLLGLKGNDSPEATALLQSAVSSIFATADYENAYATAKLFEEQRMLIAEEIKQLLTQVAPVEDKLRNPDLPMIN